MEGLDRQMEDSMIFEVQGLSKAFGGLMAVHDVNLGINKGDIHAIIGPNGAGKTTFFNLVTGYLKPTAGKVAFKNRDITKLPPYKICRRGIARSFQRVNIYPRLTAFENVQISVLSKKGKTLKLFSPSRKMVKDETEEILVGVGMQEQRDFLADSLSHGDKKRLELAIALGNDPELLLLDEPTAGMSSEETESTMFLVERLAKERNLTVLFTEHDMSVVFGISTRITVLHQGTVLAEGSHEDIKQNETVQKVYLGE
jgi:branched-chain amino acid transport system ATP-binding protein